MSLAENGIDKFLVGDYFHTPYPVYRELLERSPIFWSEIARAWIVSPFDEVEKGLNDDNNYNASERMTKASSHLTKEQLDTLPHIIVNLSNWIVFQDPPSHTRLRRLISKSFTPRSITAFEPKIEKIVSDLLDKALSKAKEKEDKKKAKDGTVDDDIQDVIDEKEKKGKKSKKKKKD